MEHPVSRRFLDDMEDMVDNEGVCNLYLSGGGPTGCAGERTLCEAGIDILQIIFDKL